MNPLTFQMTASERRALYRNNITAFISATFQVLNPDTPFQPNWHIELVASELEACLRGETHRLIINLPPRNLKSICASVAFPAFILGQKPWRRFCVSAMGRNWPTSMPYDTRRVMMSPTYRSLFPAPAWPRTEWPWMISAPRSAGSGWPPRSVAS